MRGQTRAVSPMFRGGLAAARRAARGGMIGTALDEAACPTLSDLAAAAGFSVTQLPARFPSTDRSHTAPVPGTPPHGTCYIVAPRRRRCGQDGLFNPCPLRGELPGHSWGDPRCCSRCTRRLEAGIKSAAHSLSSVLSHEFVG
jgi:hypothetical protein